MRTPHRRQFLPRLRAILATMGRSLGRAWQQRANPVGRLIVAMTGGRTVRHAQVDYRTLAAEGYQSNPIVHRCVRLIADALKSSPLQVMVGDKEAPESHPLRAVLDAPNPQQVWEELLDEMVLHWHLAGEIFLLAAVSGPRLLELYALRPDQVAVEPAEDGSVAAYVYQSGGGELRIDTLPGRFSRVLHIRNPHPLDHFRGLSPLLPAASAADEHNAHSAHAKSLLQNSARPSGLLIHDPKDGAAPMSDDQLEALRSQFADLHQGSENAGRPLFLEGALSWQATGFSPKDLDAGAGRSTAAREIALALGVPSLLLGLPGDNTFANYAEAQVALWRQTVMPLGMLLGRKLTFWLRRLDPAVRIRFDWAASPIAEAEMGQKWERVRTADYLTLDEKRAELGFQPLPDGLGLHALVSGALSTLRDIVEPPEPDPETAGLEAFGAPPQPLAA